MGSYGVHTQIKYFPMTRLYFWEHLVYILLKSSLCSFNLHLNVIVNHFQNRSWSTKWRP